METEQWFLFDGLIDVEQSNRIRLPCERPPRVRSPAASDQPTLLQQAEHAADNHRVGVDAECDLVRRHGVASLSLRQDQIGQNMDRYRHSAICTHQFSSRCDKYSYIAAVSRDRSN